MADDLEQKDLSYLISKKALDSLYDRHLWFSIFLRPPWTRFTRVQRTTCCFVLLFLMMLMDILYYDRIEQVKTARPWTAFHLGSFYITRQEIFIGVIVDLLTLLPSILLVQCFRRLSVHGSSLSRRKYRCSLFLIYGISFILIGTSISLILARGIEFGDGKTQKWFKSLLIAFASSMFFSEPIKVRSVFFV